MNGGPKAIVPAVREYCARIDRVALRVGCRLTRVVNGAVRPKANTVGCLVPELLDKSKYQRGRVRER